MNFYQENLEINISISIASSVTAYSRILMAKYKNTNQYKLHYTDTDSLYLSFYNIIKQKLFEASYVDPLELGYLKIENPKQDGKYIPYERFYFLAPKFYVGILNNKIDFSKTKIRGLQKKFRDIITEDEIKSLLDWDHFPIKIETLKWFKNLEK